MEREIENNEKRKQVIEKAHDTITANIIYAKTIQDSFMLSNEEISKILSNFFLIYNQKNIIGGDFYFVDKDDNRLTFAVGDSDGQGVPAAFVSVLVNNYLHELFTKEKELNAADTLNLLNKKMNNAFKLFDIKNRPAVDISYGIIDLKTNILQFLGANCSAFLLRDQGLIEVSCTETSIGKHLGKINYINQKIELKKNDSIYLFTNGFINQLGSENGGKFSKNRFKDLLLEVSSKSMNTQKEEIENTFDLWKGDRDQNEDVTILGIKWDKINVSN